MKATRLLHRKYVQGDFIVELVIWQLPRITSERPHGLKYRLYCGRNGNCLIRYDNETGKGDHRHCGGYEELYHFESVDKLIADFKSDCIQAGWVWE